MAYMNFTPPDTPDERWTWIPGYQPKYMISTKGRIYSRASDKYLTIRGKTVTLSDPNGYTQKHKIADLVAAAFGEDEQC